MASRWRLDDRLLTSRSSRVSSHALDRAQTTHFSHVIGRQPRGELQPPTLSANAVVSAVAVRRVASQGLLTPASLQASSWKASLFQKRKTICYRSHIFSSTCFLYIIFRFDFRQFGATIGRLVIGCVFSTSSGPSFDIFLNMKEFPMVSKKLALKKVFAPVKGKTSSACTLQGGYAR